MRLTSRSLFALAVPILVLLFLVFQAYNWHAHYAEFRSDWAVASVMTGLVFLVALAVTTPNRGLPNILRRDMMEAEHGQVPVKPGAAGDSRKAHLTFTSSVGGHVASFAGILRQVIERGVGVQPRLMLSRAGA